MGGGEDHVTASYGSLEHDICIGVLEYADDVHGGVAVGDDHLNGGKLVADCGDRGILCDAVHLDGIDVVIPVGSGLARLLGTRDRNDLGVSGYAESKGHGSVLLDDEGQAFCTVGGDDRHILGYSYGNSKQTEDYVVADVANAVCLVTAMGSIILLYVMTAGGGVPVGSPV